MPKTVATQSPAGTGDIAIPRDRWAAFFAEFTRENRGAHAVVEVLGADVGYNVQTEDRPFDGIAADVKDGEDTIWITFGSESDDHLTHGVHNVAAIWVRPPAGLKGNAVLIEAIDGGKTLLELSRPEDYALPPAKT